MKAPSLVTLAVEVGRLFVTGRLCKNVCSCNVSYGSKWGQPKKSALETRYLAINMKGSRFTPCSEILRHRSGPAKNICNHKIEILQRVILFKW